MDWATIAKLAQEGFQSGVNQWVAAAMVQGGKVNGPTAFLPPGSLSSPMKIEALMLPPLLGGRVPPEIARVLALTLSSAWEDWARLCTFTLPSAFPTFAAFPGPVAPPTPMIPIPLAAAAGAGEAMLKAPLVAAKLVSALKQSAGKATGSLDAAMKTLASWIESSYNDWKSATVLSGLIGQGPVPTFAPPYVPVGPVVMGTVMGLPGKLFTGPRFGRPFTR
jgi:hypothetical protein